MDRLILVCGSKSWDDFDTVAEVLSQYAEDNLVINGINVPGQDPLEVDFDFYVDSLDKKPDLLVAFHKNNSRGTEIIIDKARIRGIPVEVHNG